MKKPVVIIGVGEIGGVLARGLLRCGHPVYPVTRDMDLHKAADLFPPAQAVIVAVAENALQDVLGDMPKPWRDRLVLLQNELLPRDWQQHNIAQPTVLSVWFEKKPGQDAKMLLASPVRGAHAELIRAALEAVKIPCRTVADDDGMLYELVRKNLYILTTNIAGLVTGGNVEELWRKHRAIALQVAGDVLRVQAKLTEHDWSAEKLLAGMVEAFHADPQHKCTGRSAPARLIRTLALADEHGVDVPRLREIQNKL